MAQYCRKQGELSDNKDAFNIIGDLVNNFLWELHPPGAVNGAITGILLIKVYWRDFIGVTSL